MRRFPIAHGPFMGNLETLARKRNTKAIYMQEKKDEPASPACPRCARLIGLVRRGLAEKWGVGVDAIRRWEAGTQKPRNATRDKVHKAFEDHRIEFTNGDGPSIASAREGPHRASKPSTTHVVATRRGVPHVETRRRSTSRAAAAGRVPAR